MLQSPIQNNGNFYNQILNNKKNVSNLICAARNKVNTDSFERKQKIKKVTILASSLAVVAAAVLFVLKSKKSASKSGNLPPEKPGTGINTQKPQQNTEPPHIGKINSINTRPQNPAYLEIQEILHKNNLSEPDLKTIEGIFKKETGKTLFCPEIRRFKDFEEAFVALLDFRDIKKLNDAEYVIMGHGIGSSVRSNWRFEGSGKNVFEFIEENIPPGKNVLLITCETSGVNKKRKGIGSPVEVSLRNRESPAKIVKSGVREIIGSFTGLDGIKYF